MFDNYKEVSNMFREVANAIDDLGVLEDRQKAGEFIPEKEMESALGRLMFKMLELESIKEK